jgi:hypothetical protein
MSYLFQRTAPRRRSRLSVYDAIMVASLLAQLDSLLVRIDRRRGRGIEFRNQESLRSQEKEVTGEAVPLPGFLASESEFPINSRKPALPGGSSKAATSNLSEGGSMS